VTHTSISGCGDFTFKVIIDLFMVTPELIKIIRLATAKVINNYTKLHKQESRAVARKLRHAAAVICRLKFADNIHYKFRSSQTSKTRLHGSKHTGAKQNFTHNGHSRSFKVTCFGVSGNAM